MEILRELLDIEEYKKTPFEHFFKRIRDRYNQLEDKEVGEADPCFILIAYLMSMRDLDAHNKRRGEELIIRRGTFDNCSNCSDIEYIISKFARITKRDRALKKKVRDRIRTMRRDAGKFENYVSGLERYFC